MCLDMVFSVFAAHPDFYVTTCFDTFFLENSSWFSLIFDAISTKSHEKMGSGAHPKTKQLFKLILSIF